MAALMKVAEIREKSELELRELIQNLKKESMNLRFQRRTTEFKQTHRFKEIRQQNARILTVLDERQRGVS